MSLAHAAPRRCPVSIVIKAFNEERNICAAIESSLAAVAEVGGEVVLADSCSTDRTVELASRYPIRIVQLAHPQERCCGAGAQLGYQHAFGEYVYILDGDMRMLRGFLAPALAFLALHPEAAGVGGRLVELNTESLEYRERGLRAPAHLSPGEVDRLDGGGLYRRRAIEESGYFSDRNLHAYEEFELAVRLRARGWKLWRLPLDAATHFGHESPPYQLLMRRWRAGYVCALGEMLRAAAGEPWMRLVLRGMRELRIYTAVLFWWLVLLTVPFWLAPLPVRITAFAVIASAPLVLMVWRKRSLPRATYSVVSWCFYAAGLVRGLFHRRRAPRAHVPSRVLREPPQAGPAGSTFSTGASASCAGPRRSSTPMPKTRQRDDSRPASAVAGARERYIYIATPWGPVGGGMYKVTDYLIQSQAQHTHAHAAQLRPLDTRGGASAAWSLWVVLTALSRIVRGRLSGELAGVHVNIAERLSVVRKGLIMIVCRALRVPVVLHLHAYLPPFYRALPPLFQRLTRWVFSLPASVVVLGAAARRFVIEELHVPRERVEVVNNGVPEPVQGRRQREAGGKRRVLFVGRLCEAKGVSDLLAALAHPGFDRERLEVLLAGNGDVAAYRAQARDLGIAGFVHFEGWCDQAKIAQLMSASDVLVLPSHREVLPLAVLEALAHGMAVVCTPVGEIPSVLTDGQTASFVEPGDVQSIAAGLQKVLRDPGLLDALGRNGRALYERQFSLAHFFASVARIHMRHFGVAGQPRPPATMAHEDAQ